MESYKKEFTEWRKRHSNKVYDKLSEVMETTSELKVGQKVKFTNDYGVTFEPHEIVGFCKPESWGGCVYLDFDCYWCPVKLSSITLIP